MTFLQSGADLIINNLLTIKNYTSGQNGITLRELSSISTDAPPPSAPSSEISNR